MLNGSRMFLTYVYNDHGLLYCCCCQGYLMGRLTTRNLFCIHLNIIDFFSSHTLKTYRSYAEVFFRYRLTVGEGQEIGSLLGDILDIE